MKKIIFILAISLFTASFSMAQTNSNSKGKKSSTEQTTQKQNNGATVTNSGNSQKNSANGNSQAANKQKTSKGKKQGTRKK